VASLGDSFSRFGFIMRTDTQTHTEILTDVDERFTPVTVVGVNNKRVDVRHKYISISCNFVAFFDYQMERDDDSLTSPAMYSRPTGKTSMSFALLSR